MMVRGSDRVVTLDDAEASSAMDLDRLRRRREDLEVQIARLTADLNELVSEISTLESSSEDVDPTTVRLRPNELSGAAIRRVAVKTWLTVRPADAPIHYREWYSLVIDAGSVIAGQDPVATFLTQITRSPLVRRTGRPGEYVLDLEFEQRAKQELEKLYADLVRAHQPHEPYGATSDKRREERRMLAAQVEQLERAISEVVEVWTGERSEAA